MATDSTNLAQGETRLDVASDMGAGDLDPTSVQVAEAPRAHPVELPSGNQVVTIPVRPGQTIEIPTDSASGVLAKIGPEGNLAIVVDGRTIILQGYLTANEEAPVKVVTDDGDSIDVAELIAATDPSLDIQTAAGPAAGAQGGTDSSGIYIPFGPAGGLGGLNAVGVLGATALQYRLIDNETKLFDRDEDGSPQSIQIVPDEGRPVLGDQSFVLDEDDFATGTAGGPGDDAGTTTSSGTVVVDFGSDGPRDVDPIVVSGIVNGSESGLFALNPNSTERGAAILLQLDAPSGGVQVLHGYVGGVEYFTITLNTATGHFVVEQLQPLWHPDAGTEDNVPLNVQFTAFDANGDSLSAILKLSLDDDSPVATDDTDTVQEGSGDGKGGNVATGNVVTGANPELDHLGKDANSTDGNADAPGADKHYTISKLAHDGHTYTLSADGTTVLKDGAPLAAPDSFDGSKLMITTAEGATFEIVMKSANQSEVGEYRYTVGENPGHAGDMVVGPADIAATRSDAFDAAGEWQNAFTAGGINLVANGGSLAIKNVDVDPKSGFGGAEDYRGVGVDTGIDGAEVDTQGESLTLEFDPAKFPGSVNNAALLIGALFDGVQVDNGKQEILKWEAYDGGTLIASGIIVGDHDGLVTLDIDTATNFNKVVLTPLSNGAGNTGNNSDFLLVNVEICQQKDVKEEFDYTLRDGDGDESTATLTIGVEDTQPTIPGEGSGTLCLTVDEDGLPNGIGDGAPDDDASTNSNAASGNIPFAPGADPVTIELNVGNGGDTGLKTLSGKTVLAAWDAATSTLIGYVAGTDPSDAANPVFKMTVTDHNTGAVTFKLLQPVKHADGQQDDNTENNPEPYLTVNVQIEDADCDVAHTTVKVKIDDDMPVVQIAAKTSGTVQHDETQGVDSGSGDDDRSGSVPSQFNKAGLPPVGSAIGWARDGDSVVQIVDARYGADGPGSTSYALNVPAAGTPSGVSTTDGKAIWLYEGPNGTIVGRVGDGADGATTNPNGAVAFAVSIDGGGALTLVQYLSLHHPTPGSSHDETISLNTGALKAVFTLTDADGDSASDEAEIGNLVRFDDDGPKAKIETVHNKLVQHDETAGVQNPGSGNDMDQSGPLPAKFAGIVGTLIGWAKSNGAVVDTSDSAFGQDNEGATKVLSLAVKLDGVDSGIDDTATGKSILLYQQGDLVVGKLEGTDIVAFAIAINQDGTIEVAQYRALEHPNQSDHDESISIADGIRVDDSALQAVVTVTDGDGDTDVDTVDIGSKVQFDDDGPSVCLTKKDGAEIRLDESVGPSTPADGNGNDNDEAGNVSGDIGYAKVAGSDLFTKAGAYGQDGAAVSGSAVYALVLNDDDSGLFDTKTGSEVQLSTSSGSIVGRVWDGGWKTVITISVDPSSGEVTVVQYRAVKYGDAGDHDEADTPEIMDQNTVLLKLTVKDGDGDTASDTIDLGKLIKFEDDGPVALNDVDVLEAIGGGKYEAIGNVITGAGVAIAGVDDPGQDQPHAISKLQGVTTDSNASGGFVVNGVYGKLTMDANGNYSYDFDESKIGSMPEGATDVFTYTLKDKDGDTSTATLTINLPTATVQTSAVVGSEGNSLIQEDAYGPLTLTATPGTGDTVTQIVLSNVPAGWDVKDGVGDISIVGGSISGTPTYDPVTHTITFDIASAAPGVPVSVTVQIKGAEDSDVDGTGLTVSATVVDSPISVSGGSNFNVTVDAVLDDYMTADADPANVWESASGQQVNLNISIGFDPAGFSASQLGGTDTDGSEVALKALITITGDVVPLVLGGPAIPGVTLVETATPGVWQLTAGSAADLQAALQQLHADVPAGFDGTVNGKISVTTVEENTPPISIDPASGNEPQTGDNQHTYESAFDFAVKNYGGGTIAGSVGVAEDGNHNQYDQTLLQGVTPASIPFAGTVSLQIGEALTALTISGIPAGATVTLNGGAVTNGVALTGAQLAAWISGAADIRVTPPANSDADFNLSFTGQTTDSSSGATTPINGSVAVRVDAAADDPTGVSIDAKSTSGDEQFTPGETGTAKITAIFGDVSDGSESHTLTITAPAGFTLPSVADFDGIPPANVSGLGTGTITVIVPANDTGVANFTLNTLAPASYAGPAPTFTVTAKAEETSLSGGGTGVGNADDPANNIATETKSDEVTFLANIVPVTYDDKVSGSEPAPRNVNVMLIIDRSLSMTDEVSAGVTRFELLQEATINMLNAMKANGDVRVMIVTFHTTASAANAWVSVDDAIAAISAMSPASGSGDNGYTNYEAALAAAINAFADTDGRGSFADHDNDVYFLSDGKPTSGGTTSGNSTDKDHSLTDGQLQNWDKFLETGGNSIDHLHAIGIGADIVAGDSDLKDVADPDYPGDSDSKNPFGQVTIVTNETALEDVLEGTAVTPITGNILNGSIELDPDAPLPNTPDFQGDGPAHVSYFKYDGAGATNDVTITWDGAGALSVSGGKSVSVDGSDTNKISFETDHGRMIIDFSTGTFDFAPDSVTADKNEVFDYKITDSNGDVSNQSSLTVAIEDNYANLAVPLTSHTFANGGWPGSVSDSGFNNSGNTKSGSGTNDDGWDGEGGDDSLSGGNGNDYLVGGSGDDALNGGNHNDRLEGGNDNDTLNGNDGNDLLIGGSGLDKFDGGAGNDWLDVDSSDFGTGRSIHGGAGIDVLDLSGIGTFTLTGKTSNVDGIEVVSLEGGGADTVSLKASDVTDLADGNELFVWGDGGDKVNLTNGGWSAGETNVIGSDGSTYNAFNNGAVKVYVETEVTVAMS